MMKQNEAIEIAKSLHSKYSHAISLLELFGMVGQLSKEDFSNLVKLLKYYRKCSYSISCKIDLEVTPTA